MFCFVFFFKQKTAYEMRISDWSSDVCSSDLGRGGIAGGVRVRDRPPSRPRRLLPRLPAQPLGGAGGLRRHRAGLLHGGRRERLSRVAMACGMRTGRAALRRRSEEHTSELQSLMRISYAVFCLKKKKKQNRQRHTRSKHNETHIMK